MQGSSHDGMVLTKGYSTILGLTSLGMSNDSRNIKNIPSISSPHLNMKMAQKKFGGVIFESLALTNMLFDIP